MGDFWHDVRFALRSFRRTPGFSVAAVLVLGIGIGAVTLMFGTLHAVVLQPLPFREPDRLVWGWLSSDEFPANSISAADYFDYRDRVGGFESLAAFMVFRPPAVLTGGGEAERVVSTYVSANLFTTLGVAPRLGRTFRAAEEKPDAADVVILSHGLWQRRFGGDESILGTGLTVDGKPYDIAGVMPAEFDFPRGVELWFPLRTDAGYARGRSNNNFYIIGRLRDAVPLEQVQAQVDVVARNIAEAFPADREGWGMRLVPLHERFFGTLRSSMLLLLGLITLVPLVACANVALLFLARATDRGGEFAVRLALGGSRPRLVRQVVTEGLVIALAGGALGVAMTWMGGEAFRSLAPAALPRLESVGVDGTILAFALAVSFATVPLFAIVPALRGTKINLSEALKAGGARGFSAGRSRLRNSLVVFQVALSLMLMIALGLFVRSYVRLQDVDPGFEARRVLSFELQLPAFKYDTGEKIDLAWTALRQRMRALPGVETVGAIDQLPVRDGGTWNYVHAADRPPTTPADRMGAQRRFAAEGFFRTLRVPLLAGRTFEPGDRMDAPPVVVINRTMAERFFPGESPVGKGLVLSWEPPVNMEVVGVVGDVREYGPADAPPPVFYMASRQFPPDFMRFVIRTTGDPLAMVATLRRTIREVDGDIPFSQAATMESRLADSLGRPRFRAVIVGLFAVVALLLAAIGLYGVLVCFVRQRARELSIRLALGARAWDIFALVVGRGMAMVGLGIAAGLAGGLAAARLMRSLLFEIAPNDALTFGGVSLCLGLVALAACLLPARRAIKIDPSDALKAE